MAELMKNISKLGLFSDYSCEKGNFTTKLRLGLASEEHCGEEIDMPFCTSGFNRGAKRTVAELSARVDLTAVGSSSNSITLLPDESGFGSPVTVLGGLEKIRTLSDDDQGGCSGLLTSFRSTSSTILEKQSGSQLTIFYCGKVNVYEDIPTDKAQAIMLMASSGNYTNYHHSKVQNSCGSQTEQKLSVPVIKSSQRSWIETQPASRKAHTGDQGEPFSCSRSNLLGAEKPDIPIARKHSLQRFLQKRKDRVNAKAKWPYKTTEADDPEPH